MFLIPDSPPSNDDFLNPDSTTEPQSSDELSLVVIVGVVVGGIIVLLLIGVFIGLFFLCYYYPNRYAT